jgi:uncharacterized repeat protein (TIGR01451 family)
MKIKFLLGSILCLTVFALNSQAQVVRNYGLVYSDNLKGGHTMFGNTMMAIKDNNGNILTSQMNDFGNYSYGATSQYDNNNSNMQFVDVDANIPNTSVIAYGDQWKYYSLNNYSAAPADISGKNWKDSSYSEASNWTSINTPFGFNETGTYSPSQTDRTTYYLRKSVNISNPDKFNYFDLTVKYDDGFVLYVNGTEVARANMPNGTPSYSTNASSSREFGDGDYLLSIPTTAFVAGNNQIAVEVHQKNSGPNDLYFNMKLEGVENTNNSSSADLVLPPGTNTIKFARLYWGGRILNSAIQANDLNLRTVRIRKGTSGQYFKGITSVSQVDKSTIDNSSKAYQSYIDITSFIAQNGAGTYTVADIAGSIGSSSGGNYAGWSIVVVYENSNSNYNSVRVYDGFLQVYNNGNATSQSITLTGLNAPSNQLLPSEAYMSVMAWEGDATLAGSAGNPSGDYILLNNDTLSNAVNPKNNIWNGTISDNGSFVTTKNPDFKNQMGIDIDKLDVGNYIAPNATSLTIKFGTEADQYFPSAFAFTMKMKDPVLTLDKTVTDAVAPMGALNPNEQLTYVISGTNNGTGVAYNVIVTDTLPASVTYIPGTLEVISSPGITAGIKTDNSGDDIASVFNSGGYQIVTFNLGTGATSANGGQLQPGESYSVRFKVTGPAIPVPVVNTARITANSQAGDIFTDDGTAIIAPSSGLAVKISRFNVVKSAGNAIVSWSTSSEVNNDHFEIERSEDGISFVKVGTVAGRGTSNVENNYQFIDALSAVRGSIVYYRLRSVETTGKATYSQMVALRLNGSISMSNFAVYPNPFTSNIKMMLNSTKESNVSLRIVSVSGQVMISRNVTVQAGQNIVVMNDLNTLNKGIYMLEIISEDGKITQTVIKE